MAHGEQVPVVGIVMGSDSDLEFMGAAAEVLEELAVPYEIGFTSAHRTPDLMMEYGATAKARGLRVIIAGAGGSAHLPGMMASETLLPVKGVAIGRSPHEIEAAIGSMIFMPKGVDLDFVGVNEAGAFNAGLSAIRVVAQHDKALDERNETRRLHMGDTVRAKHALVGRIGARAYRDAMAKGTIKELLEGK